MRRLFRGLLDLFLDRGLDSDQPAGARSPVPNSRFVRFAGKRARFGFESTLPDEPPVRKPAGLRRLTAV